MTTNVKGLPLLSHGTFGTHLLLNPAERFSFFGSVPQDLAGRSFDTEAEGIDAFVTWMRSLPHAEQRTYVGGLRQDVWKAFIERPADGAAG